jgi:shikimate kinase/3-dehydroquinate synthase
MHSHSSKSADEAETSAHSDRIQRIRSRLGDRSIVLVGMMGAGKTSVGRRLANRLGLPFVDADAEIERAAGMTIPEIFESLGEAAFRDGERRIIARLLAGNPAVLATGGGAFMDEGSRKAIADQGISIFLRAEFDVLIKRVRKRSNRPLLRTPDPEGTLKKLIAARYPVYSEAALTLDSRDAPHELVVEDALSALDGYLSRQGPPMTSTDAPPNPTPTDPIVVPVNLSSSSYRILIGPGLIDRAGSFLAELNPEAKVAIVTDDIVAGLHLQRLHKALDARQMLHSDVIVRHGEASKDWETLQSVCNALLEAKLERRDLVLALGGGVVGDLAGFAASITRRGLRVVQLPTTLLAQVDSSVGGKTGINTRHGKNLVGTFHQPALVLADTSVLDTLPSREYRAGYAEVVKYGLLGDLPFFEWLEGRWERIRGDGPERVHAVAASCRAKAAIVMRDEREDGERALLNLGHTFGHALERHAGFDGARLVHGEAVAIGLAMAFRYSQRLGLISGQDVERVNRHLVQAGLPTTLADIPGERPSASALLDAMAQDKKVQRGRLTFVLVRGIGRAFVERNVAADDMSRFLAEEGALASPAERRESGR